MCAVFAGDSSTGVFHTRGSETLWIPTWCQKVTCTTTTHEYIIISKAYLQKMLSVFILYVTCSGVDWSDSINMWLHHSRASTLCLESWGCQPVSVSLSDFDNYLYVIKTSSFDQSYVSMFAGVSISTPWRSVLTPCSWVLRVTQRLFTSSNWSRPKKSEWYDAKEKCHDKLPGLRFDFQVSVRASVIQT